MAQRVIYIVRSWPRLSQTFVLNEVLALERRGLELAIFSLVHSDDDLVHGQVADVRAPVEYVEDARVGPLARRLRPHLAQLRRTPVHYVRSLVTCWRRPELVAGYGEASALECFDMAVRVSDALAEMPADGSTPVHVHAHFAHDPALVGMIVARLAGLPFTFTAHARDLIQISVEALAARASAAKAIVTCCALNADYLDSALPTPGRPPVLVIHHGVDLRRFEPMTVDSPADTPTLVSVGRLVEKKGFEDLLRALRAAKDSGRRFRCEIYGDGPEGETLVALCASLGLSEDVTFLGAKDTDDIAAALRRADLFVLSPRVAADGDRDGIPNVLVEAMASGLPVVTTTAGGIAELVQHEVNGLLAQPGDVAGIAGLLCDLIDDDERRRRFGVAARAAIEGSYDVDAAARELHRLMMRPAPETVELVR
ncbi:MAG TPA: glycosyltransferase [Marmoricola sp.]|nr:glycosyltransferase [Marmoricola sp.]